MPNGTTRHVLQIRVTVKLWPSLMTKWFLSLAVRLSMSQSVERSSRPDSRANQCRLQTVITSFMIIKGQFPSTRNKNETYRNAITQRKPQMLKKTPHQRKYSFPPFWAELSYESIVVVLMHNYVKSISGSYGGNLVNASAGTAVMFFQGRLGSHRKCHFFCRRM